MKTQTKMNRKYGRLLHIKNKTAKNRSNRSNRSKYTTEHITLMFLQMLNTVKLFHWKTRSYAQHKATDDLYSNLNSSIDSFIEILLGKTGSRVNLSGVKHLPLHDFNNSVVFEQEIEMYKKYLIEMTNHTNHNIVKSGLSEKQDTDLINVRDEILGHLNQFTYLLTFK